MTNRVLQPHDLAERGWITAEAPGPATVSEVFPMAITGLRQPQAQYVLEEDCIETLPDGRTIQVGVKGASIPMSEAIRLGLVADPEEAKKKEEAKKPAPEEAKPAAGPTEVKVEPAVVAAVAVEDDKSKAKK